MGNPSRTNGEPCNFNAANTSGHSHEVSKSQENPFGTSNEDDFKPRNRRDRRHHHHLTSFDIKIEIREFEGKNGRNEFLDWL